jgi:hypothetical protein
MSRMFPVPTKAEMSDMFTEPFEVCVKYAADAVRVLIN